MTTLQSLLVLAISTVVFLAWRRARERRLRRDLGRFVAPQSFDWPEPWADLAPGERKMFEQELAREVSSCHPLRGHVAMAIARMTDSLDDCLFLTSHPAMPVCRVHLTWSEEHERWWPEAEGWRSLDAFRADWRFRIAHPVLADAIQGARLVLVIGAVLVAGADLAFDLLRMVWTAFRTVLPVSRLRLLAPAAALGLAAGVWWSGEWRERRRIRYLVWANLLLLVPEIWAWAGDRTASMWGEAVWFRLWLFYALGVPVAVAVIPAVAGARSLRGLSVAFSLSSLAHAWAVWMLLLSRLPKG